jgi:arylformamidase
MPLYDITPLASSSLAVWPGDAPLEREVMLDLRRGDSVTLSAMRATVHLGAHADAPSHYGLGAPAIHERDLSLYLGPCEVVRVAARPGGRVGVAALRGWQPSSPRVLLATGTVPDRTRFTEDFAALDPDLVDRLAAAGVRLVGIDTPSVDLFADRALLAHHRCLAHDIAILEGLLLDTVPEGRYELIALPLKIEGFDASPVRAVLRA